MKIVYVLTITTAAALVLPVTNSTLQPNLIDRDLEHRTRVDQFGEYLDCFAHQMKENNDSEKAAIYAEQARQFKRVSDLTKQLKEEDMEVKDVHTWTGWLTQFLAGYTGTTEEEEARGNHKEL
jgi:hypothetical protein